MKQFNETHKKFYKEFKKREFYPRNIKGKLSDDFINSFQTEIKRLEEEEEIPRSKAVSQISKALKFHSES